MQVYKTNIHIYLFSSKMAAPWFINILLAVTFATVVSAWYTCGSLEMIKEVTTSDKFEQTLRKTYKNVTSKLDCARLCYEDVRCNGILVCPDVCYLFGVFNAAMSHGPATAQSSASELDYRTCEIFTIVSITSFRDVLVIVTLDTFLYNIKSCIS